MLPLLLPDPGLRLDRVEITPATITLALRTTTPTASCPDCAQSTHQIHSRYTRHARDLPIHGCPTRLRLTARRFFCNNPDCPRRIFCERLPLLLTQHAQATMRLTDTQRHLGLALGGQPGSRLATKLGMPTSGDTLLRRVQQTPPATDRQPRRVVGIDDWAIRKGHTYGTILIDLERSEVLELLPGRDGVGLKTWLRQHPESEVLSRDRASAFAEAATEAAPQAKQVADRFHLLKNIREALERFLDRHAGGIREAFACPVQTPAPQTPNPAVQQAVPPSPLQDPAAAATTEPPLAAARQRPPSAKQQSRLERYQEVRRRHAQGQSLQRISRDLGLTWRTTRRYAQSDHCPDWRPGRIEPSAADDYRDRIDTWLAAGYRNVSALHRQLQAEGAALGYDALRYFVTRRLAARGERRQRLNAVQPPPRPPPSAKGLPFAVIAKPTERTDTQQAQVARLRERNAELAQAVELVEEFAALLRKQSGTTLADWQEKVRNGASSELRRFVEGLERDQAAVQAAVDEAWSNGMVGNRPVNPVLYGRIRWVNSPLRMHPCRPVSPIPPANGSGGSDWPGGRIVT